LYAMAKHNLDIATFEAQADKDDGIFGDHLRRQLFLIHHHPELADTVLNLLRGDNFPTGENFYQLCGAGILAGDLDNIARFRCRVYETFFTRHLSSDLNTGIGE
jgi:hypothetical protein